MNNQDAKKCFNRNRRNFSAEQANEVISQAEVVNDNSQRGALKIFFSDITDMFTMICAYSSGKYRAVPWATIAAMGGTLLYVISPVDLIPDFIPILGYVDDAAVFAACMKMVKVDLDIYRKWKNKEN
jgi:uncharacterized membrane protein YkvA (DUF1232 family)